MQIGLVGAQAGQVQQIGDQRVHAIGALLDVPHQSVAHRRFGIAVEQQSDRGADQRQRRAQLVRHRQQQLGPQLLDLIPRGLDRGPLRRQLPRQFCQPRRLVPVRRPLLPLTIARLAPTW